MNPQLDWSDYQDAGMGDPYADIPRHGGDYAKAVSVCIRSGLCQRDDHRGLMCPSFQASGDPLLSPGERARLLKSALNQPNGLLSPVSPELRRAMDSCLGCKGCRRECENNIDMARIKLEYLAQQPPAGSLPVRLRNRLFADLPGWLHRKPQWGRLISWRNRFKPLAWLVERALRIPAAVHLPEPAPSAFQAYRRHSLPADQCDLVLFVDTFTHYFDPQVADAALRVLQQAGYRVAIAAAGAGDTDPERPLCCGRTQLSQGRLDNARREAQRVIAALAPYVEAGKPVVGLEPSCLLTLRDEYLALNLGQPAQDLATASLLLEEFITREQKTGRWPLELRLPQQVAAFPHCHQRAFGAMRALRRLLKSVRELRFSIAETSCCGMAGHFGLEAEQRALSTPLQAAATQAIAEPAQAVLANGFSCRHHLVHSQPRPVYHLAELLDRARPAAERQRPE